MTHTPEITEPAQMGFLSRFIGGDKPETEWIEGETIQGTYIGWNQMEFEGKPVPMFNLLEQSGTLVRFLGTSQTNEIIYLPAGIQIAVTYVGKGVSSKGRRVKLFQIRCDADALAARAAAIRQQLLNPGSTLALPAPLPALTALEAAGEPEVDE